VLDQCGIVTFFVAEPVLGLDGTHGLLEYFDRRASAAATTNGPSAMSSTPSATPSGKPPTARMRVGLTSNRGRSRTQLEVRTSRISEPLFRARWMVNRPSNRLWLRSRCRRSIRGLPMA